MLSPVLTAFAQSELLAGFILEYVTARLLCPLKSGLHAMILLARRYPITPDLRPLREMKISCYTATFFSSPSRGVTLKEIATSFKAQKSKSCV